jgi:hypothetical protein
LRIDFEKAGIQKKMEDQVPSQVVSGRIIDEFGTLNDTRSVVQTLDWTEESKEHIRTAPGHILK